METKTTEGDILAALKLMSLSYSIRSKRLNIELATQYSMASLKLKRGRVVSSNNMYH